MATYRGTNGADSYAGPSSNDQIYGSDGDDTLSGGAGSDRVYGQDDNDLLFGDAGFDYLYGLQGNDTLWGGADDDQLYGGNYQESSYDFDDDVLYGEGGDDILAGGWGNDYLDGGDDDDDLDGGEGNDTLIGGAGDDVLDGRAGDDWMVMDSVSGAGRDYMSGGAGNDTIVDLWGNNEGAMGGAGDDSIYVDGAYARGNAGNDTLRVDLNTLNSTSYYGDEGNDLLFVETDLAEGVSVPSYIYMYGGEGDDTIVSRDGAGAPPGPAGTSSFYRSLMYGDDGHDLLIGSDEHDRMLGGRASGTSGNDTIFGGAGDDSIDSGDTGDQDTVVYLGALADYSITAEVDASSGTVTLFVSDLETEVAHLVSGVAQFAPHVTQSYAVADEGNDTLRGIEVLQFSDVTVRVDQVGTEGDDSLTGSDATDLLNGLGGDDTIDGGAGADLLIGGAGQDVLIGGTGTDRLQGGTGDDVLNGGAGDDVLIAGEGADWLFGGAGDDSLEGDAEDHAVVFGARANFLIETNGARTVLTDLVGTEGRDTLDGVRWIEFSDSSLFLNTAPEAQADAVSVGANPVTLDLGALAQGAFDAEGDAVTLAQVQANGLSGTLTDLGGGLWRYDPAAVLAGLAGGASATESFTYSVTDAYGLTDTAQVTLTITRPNEAPVAGDDFVAIGSGVTVALDVLANDSDSDGGSLQLVSVSGAAFGTVQIDDQGTADPLDDVLVYTPDAGAFGRETLTYVLSDGVDTVAGQAEVLVAEPGGGLILPENGVTLGNETTDFQARPVSARLETGETVVAWHAAADERIRFQMLGADGAPTGPIVDVDGGARENIGGYLIARSVAITALESADGGTTPGGFVLAYASGASNLGLRIYDATGQEVSSQSLYTPADGAADVTAVQGGGFALVYPAPGGGSAQDIVYARYGATGAVEVAPMVIGDASTLGGTAQLQAPDVATLSDGRQVIVAHDGMTGTTLSAVVSASGALEQPMTALAGPVSFLTAEGPQVTALAGGGYVVTGLISDASAQGVGAQVYTADGQPVGAFQQVNVLEWAHQIRPSVTALADGGFAVAWMSFDADVIDGTDPGWQVKVRLFAANGTPVTGEVVVSEAPFAADFAPHEELMAVTLIGDGATEPLRVSYVSDLSDGWVVSRPLEALLYAPTTADDSRFGSEDGLALTGSVLENDSGQGLEVTGVAVAGGTTQAPGTLAGLYGSLTLGADGSYSYEATDPNELLGRGAQGTDSFVVTVTDDIGRSLTETLSFTIDGWAPNTLPVAVSDLAQTDNRTAITLDALSNDSDADGDPLTILSVDTTGLLGQLTDLGNGRYRYDPSAGLSGLAKGATQIETISYVLSDGEDTVAGQMQVTVTGANSAPDAQDDSGAAGYGMAVTLDVLANDSDVDGDVLELLSVGAAAHGTVTIDRNGTSDPSDDRIIYTPDAGHEGSDSFSYVLSDGSDTISASVEVITAPEPNTAPVAVDDVFDGTAVSEFLVNGNTSGDQNRSDLAATPDGGFVAIWQTASSVAGVRGIDLALFDATGAKIGSDVAVPDVIRYSVQEPTVTVLTNGTIVAMWYDYYREGEYAPGVYARMFDATGTPLGGDFLVNSQTQGSQYSPQVAALAGGGFVALWQTNHAGTLDIAGRVFAADGTPLGGDFAVNTVLSDLQTVAAVAALPDGGFVTAWQSMEDEVYGNLYTIKARFFDATGAATVAEFAVGGALADRSESYPSVTVSEAGTVLITWTESNILHSRLFDSAGVAQGPVLQMGSRIGTTTVTALEDGRFAVIWSEMPSSDGSTGDGSSTGLFGSILNADGSVAVARFAVNQVTDDVQSSPEAVALAGGGFAVVWDSNYDATDGSRAVKGMVFDAEGRPALSGGTWADRSLTAEVDALLANDSDANGDSLSVVAVDDSGAQGQVVLNGDGTWTYDPNGAFDALAEGETATDSFGYVLGDGEDTVAGQVTVTIIGVNDAPLPQDDSGSGLMGEALSLDVLANDLDPEDEALALVSVGAAQNGTVSIDDRGTADMSDDRLIYTPDAGFSGQDSFVYTVSDGSLSATAEVTVTVVAPPVTLTTGSGNSSLVGGSGADTLTAGSGDDTIDAGAGDDVITTGRPGNTGRDFGNDTVFAGAGNDSVMGSNGTDYIEGGEGDDTLDGGNDVNSADADTLLGGAGNDLLISGQGRLPTLATQDRGDEMRGGEGDDTALGGRANDLIEGGTGTDSLRGGEGNDVIYAGLEAHVLAGTVDVHGLDTIRGDYGDDTIYGADGAQELYGDGRQDWIYGGNEGESSDTDTLWGGAGNDRLFSGQTVVPTSGMGDILYGEWGYDTLVGGAADDLLVGGDENDSLEGGAGDDTLYVGVETALLGGSGGSYGIDTARGGDGDDLIVGSNGANLLVGDAGDDTISGGNDLASADTDTIRGGTGDDVLYSGQVVRPSTPAYQLRGDLLMGEEGHDTLVGGLANDTLEGGTGDDSLSGGDGDDVLYTGLESAALANTGGGFGTDTAHGGAGDDVLWGANGTQVLYGDAGNDTLHGGNDLASAEADSLFGGAGDDLLISGQVVTPTASSAGRGDWLEGGAGDDTLVGGLAADSFVFGPDAGGGVDLVQGFEQGSDVIGLQGFGAGAVVSFAQSGADVALSVDGVLVALFEDAQVGTFDAADYLLL